MISVSYFPGYLDFGDPFVVPGSSAAKPSSSESFSEESLSMLTSMGFSQEQAIFAMKQTSGNLERAADWLFSHMSQLDSLMASEQSEVNQQTTDEEGLSGTGKYRIKAFISHIGPSAHAGHYVCHILKDGKWIFFNDRKVALSQKVPRDFAYIYVFESI
eukprot:gene3607-6199_t